MQRGRPPVSRRPCRTPRNAPDDTGRRKGGHRVAYRIRQAQRPETSGRYLETLSRSPIFAQEEARS
jgi:hypothetical protein